MFDIKALRDDARPFAEGWRRRGLDGEALVKEIQAADTAHLETVKALQEAQTRRNDASKQIGQAMGQGAVDRAEALKAEVSALKDKMHVLEQEERDQGEALRGLLAGLPNLPASDVPDGADEDANLFRHDHGTKPELSFPPKEHDDLGTALGLMDFETAAKISGARFVVLKGGLARLERALAAFMLDLHTGEFGYTEVNPPFLVRDDAVYGTAQLPKFEEDLFKTANDYWLIPTSEVPLTNLVRESIQRAEDLPLRFTALTPCFRSEAGSAGRDTRGMIRQHQFSKVELVGITTPDQSQAEHERMLSCAEEVLKRLGLHYRVMTLSTGDMGFAARKTYDIEVWLPGQGAYREISSVSNCGDFQSRRMNARCRPEGEKKTEFVHTLNGSGLAIGRCLVAVLENYQQADGAIVVPEVLQPYMGGLTVIEA